MATLNGIDLVQSILTFCLFMYANLWYHNLTTGSWPYFNKTFPNLYALEGNAVVVFMGMAIFLLSLLHFTICKYLSKTAAYAVS